MTAEPPPPGPGEPPAAGAPGPPPPPEPAARVPDREAPPSPFARLGPWDWVAFVAALALMLTMSIDWYTTKQGEEFRRVEKTDRDTTGQQVEPTTPERAAEAAEREEKNAWQANAFVDRLILVALLAAFAAAAANAFLRAAGRRVDPNPAAVASLAGLAGAVLILYRMVQEPGLDDASVLKVGAPLSLVAVGVLAFAARTAVLAEREAARPLGAS